ncbi:17450_t:CDS:1, partial [Dentiscutata heterogama]
SDNIYKLLTTCYYQNNQLPKEFSKIVPEVAAKWNDTSGFVLSPISIEHDTKSDISTIAIIVKFTDSVKDNNIHNSKKETINNKASISNNNNIVPTSNQYDKFFTNILSDLDYLEN